MGIVFNPAGLVAFILMLISFNWAARHCALGALSLPCITLLTGLIYFFLMPLVFIAGEESDFFGLAFDDLMGMHIAVALYAVGAMAAFVIWNGPFRRDPRAPAERQRTVNPILLWSILGIAVAGVFAKAALGILTLGDTSISASGQADNVNFLQLSDSLLISLTVIFLVRTNFGMKALALLCFTTAVFLIDGFRFRLVILGSASLIAFALTRRISIRTSYVGLGSVVSIMLLNAVGLSRRYGAGLDLEQVRNLNLSTLFGSFGGEVGPVFVLMHLTQHKSPLIGFEPWVIAVTRLIPSFLWSGKPEPTYLSYYWMGFPDPRAMTGGIAGTQQAEFYLQFGWLGIPILAFLFFSVAACVQHRMRFLSYEGRIAGAAIIPSLFGFYAQQRGYAFQQLCEILFTLVPVFLVHSGISVRKRRSEMRLESITSWRLPSLYGSEK